MIVPTMTLPEIKQAVFTDYKAEIRPKLNAISVTYSRKWIKDGRRDGMETILVPAKSKNDWRICIHTSQDGVSPTPYLITYDNIGIRAFHIATLGATEPLMYFNTHFFKRYKERAKLSIEKPEDLVKHFFKKNYSGMIPCYNEMDDGSHQLFVPLIGGIGLGIHHKDDDIYEFKTFVDDSLLTENQKKQVEEIYIQTFKEIMEVIQNVTKLPKRNLY